MTPPTDDRKGVFVPLWAIQDTGGDCRDAMVLAQITWWLQPSQREGRRRVTAILNRDGYDWLYMTDAELGADIGLSDDQVYRARRSLRSKGLIVTMTRQVAGARVTLMRRAETDDDQTADPRFANREVAETKPRGRGFQETADPRFAPSIETIETNTETTTCVAALVGFDAFWAAYPRNTAKGTARAAWPGAVRAAGGEWVTIVAGATRFAADPNRVAEFTPHPSTWLRGERWADGPLPARGRPNVKPGLSIINNVDTDRDGPGGRIDIADL